MHTPSASDVAYFRAFGVLVLREAFEPGPLAAEVDWALREGLLPSSAAPIAALRHFRYVPMMSAETPVSLALLDRLEPVAAALLESAVLPTRAKGTVYQGDTSWHADATLPIRSVGAAAYLDPLDREGGALRVLPGSHRRDLTEALETMGATGAPAATLPAHIVETRPGDVIVFDEHLFHASAGGSARKQWRVDFLADPNGESEESLVWRYFRGIFAPDWECGYDAERFASYGPHFRASGRRCVARLEELGICDLATAQESASRR